MSDDKYANRIPFETLGDQGSVTSWRPPNIDEHGRVLHPSKKPPKSSSKEIIEDVPRTKKPRALTAEELENITREAQEEGYKTGYAEGLTKGREDGLKKGEAAGKKQAYDETRVELENERSRLASIAGTLQAPMEAQQQQLENILVDMAINFARKLVQSEINTNPTLLFNLVSRALQELPAGAKNITVYLNEDDAGLLQEVAPGKTRWHVEIDHSLQPGGCRVETAESLVDFDVATRLGKYLDDVVENGYPEEEDLAPVMERPEEARATQPGPEPDAHGDDAPEKGEQVYQHDDSHGQQGEDDGEPD